VGNKIVGLADVDLYGGLGTNAGQTLFFNGPAGPNGNGSGKYLNSQAISAYGWSSVGNPNYNALQVSLRKQFSQGLQFDLNYALSKSIDITSTASRVGFARVGYQNIGLLGSRLENAFRLNDLRSVSDFDTTHQFNANWIADLPFGRGKRFATDAGSVANTIIGGWQLSGVARYTSGLPVSIDVGQNWPTDWQYTGLAQMVVPTKAGGFRQPNGSVSLFRDPATAQASFGIPFPGGSGLAQRAARLGLCRPRHGPEQELQDLREPEPDVPLGNLQRAEPGSLQRAGRRIDCAFTAAGPKRLRHLFRIADPTSRHAFALRYEF
jgi:hypothetical protein